MNICTPGNCICDAREWEGDTNCMGEISCGLCNKEHIPGPCQQYICYCGEKFDDWESKYTHEVRGHGLGKEDN